MTGRRNPSSLRSALGSRTVPLISMFVFSVLSSYVEVYRDELAMIITRRAMIASYLLGRILGVSISVKTETTMVKFVAGLIMGDAEDWSIWIQWKFWDVIRFWAECRLRLGPRVC